MNESKALALSVVVAIAGAIIVVIATSGVVHVPNDRRLPAAASSPSSPTEIAAETPPATLPRRPSPTPTPPLPTSPPTSASSMPLPTPTPTPALVASPSGQPAAAVVEASLASVLSAPVRLLIAPTPTPPPVLPPVLPPEVDRSGDFHPFPVPGGIEQVDFANGFTYPIGGVGPVLVEDGTGTRGEPGTEDFADVRVGSIIFGDLTGDGVDDAVVVVEAEIRTWGTSSQVWVFSVDDGLVRRAGLTFSGAIGRGGLRSLTIDDGILRIESLNDPATAVISSRWVVSGDVLRRVEESMPRPWVDVRSGQPGGLHPVDGYVSPMLWATVVADRSSPVQTLTFDAAGPWMARMTSENGHGALVRIRDRSGRLIGDLRDGAPVHLPGEGTYLGEIRFAVDSTAEVTFALDVADQRTLSSPTWRPQFSSTIERSPAAREVTATWPEFDVTSGVASSDVLNTIITDFIVEQEQSHAQAIATCADDEDAIQSITYRPTLVSYDLVAIEFNEFVCLCDEDDEYRQHSVIVDLNTGQRLGVDQIVATDSPALRELWWETNQARGRWLPDGVVVGATPLEVVGASLTPYGVDLRTRLLGLPDGPVDMSMFMTFEELGGLVRPGIAVRAASGAHAPYPLEDSCGC